MQSVSRLLVAVFAVLLGVLPALRAGCDLNCGPRPVQPGGHCSNHSDPSGDAPARSCGHDHTSTGTVTQGAGAPFVRFMSVAAAVQVFSLPAFPDQAESSTIVAWLLATPPIESVSIPLRL
jgi:hypothetical protein